jgi:hypothetical protein
MKDNINHAVNYELALKIYRMPEDEENNEGILQHDIEWH